MQQRRHRNVVRKIGNYRCWRYCQLVTADCQDVAVQHGQLLDLAVGVFGNGLRQPLREYRVDFDGDHGGAAVEQSQRERPEAGTYFQDQVRPADSGGRNDAAHRVGVVDEVLAE